jgi:hypothetical protein
MMVNAVLAAARCRASFEPLGHEPPEFEDEPEPEPDPGTHWLYH